MEKKMLKKSKFEITMYVISGLLAVYTVYMLYSTITYLTSYFSQYGSSLSSNFGTAIGYILTQCLVYLVYAILTFAAAKIYHEVRKANPDNYLSEAESKAILRAKEAKKAAKAEAKVVKEEAKAEEVSEEPKDEAAEDVKEETSEEDAKEAEEK
ncbi:MAG: hypothetical protein Q4C18_03860 [Eubacteriales bacterium]|nr:hypothetical protein [Eubacteriales bacterium]